MNLPKGWVLATLGDVCSRITDGVHKTPKYVSSGVPFISIANIRPFEPIDWDAYRRYVTHKAHAELIQRCHAEYDDVVFTRIGTLGVAKRIDFDQPVSLFVGLGLLKPNRNAVDSRYLEAWMNSPAIVSLSKERATGTGRQTLALEETRRFPVPLPPLNEQRRIAAKLAVLLRRTRQVRDRLELAFVIVERFRKAVLEAAISGRLTETWRSIHGAPPWQTANVGDVLEEVRYGTAVKCSYKLRDATPVLRIPNVVSGRIEASDLKFGPLEESERAKYALRRGDLLMVRSNGSADLVGRVAYVPQGFEKYAFAGYLMRLRPMPSVVESKYLQVALSAPDVRDHIVLHARSSSGVHNINAAEVRNLRICIGSLDEQREIVRRVDKLTGLADSLERQYRAALAQFERLTPALLAKAFRGELVQQDPTDEPAEKLLQRVCVPSPRSSSGRKRAAARRQGNIGRHPPLR